jgi:hypothetical protein
MQVTGEMFSPVRDWVTTYETISRHGDDGIVSVTLH